MDGHGYRRLLAACPGSSITSVSGDCTANKREENKMKNSVQPVIPSVADTISSINSPHLEIYSENHWEICSIATISMFQCVPFRCRRLPAARRISGPANKCLPCSYNCGRAIALATCINVCRLVLCVWRMTANQFRHRMVLLLADCPTCR